MENSKKYTVDRFEGKYAVCESENFKFINIEKKRLPKGVNEGDVIYFDGKKYVIDLEKTNDRKKYIEDLTRELWM